MEAGPNRWGARLYRGTLDAVTAERLRRNIFWTETCSTQGSWAAHVSQWQNAGKDSAVGVIRATTPAITESVGAIGARGGSVEGQGVAGGWRR
jgi:hypothetical protein